MKIYYILLYIILKEKKNLLLNWGLKKVNFKAYERVNMNRVILLIFYLKYRKNSLR